MPSIDLVEAGAGETANSAMSLAALVGFVTEFNTNALLFELAAGVLVEAIAYMAAIEQIARTHQTAINTLELVDSIHTQHIDDLQEKLDRLQALVDPLYRSAQHNPPWQSVATAG